MAWFTVADIEVMSSPAQHPQYMIFVPRGTRCKMLDNAFVVDDTSRVVGGNAHDLAHYYIWLGRSDVEEA